MHKHLLFLVFLCGLTTAAPGAAKYVILKSDWPPAGVPPHKPGKCFVIRAMMIIGDGSPAISYRLGDIYPSEAEAEAAMKKIPECI
jgi:hypothetical protein